MRQTAVSAWPAPSGFCERATSGLSCGAGGTAATGAAGGSADSGEGLATHPQAVRAAAIQARASRPRHVIARTSHGSRYRIVRGDKIYPADGDVQEGFE